MTEAALEPCPFCRSRKISITTMRDGLTCYCRCGGRMSAFNGSTPTRERLIAAWNRRSPGVGEEGLAAYDAGLLSDYGGGNVDWWHDYIRAELDRAHEFYASQVGGGEPALFREALEAIADGEGDPAVIARQTLNMAAEPSPPNAELVEALKPFAEAWNTTYGADAPEDWPPGLDTAPAAYGACGLMLTLEHFRRIAEVHARLALAQRARAALRSIAEARLESAGGSE